MANVKFKSIESLFRRKKLFGGEKIPVSGLEYVTTQDIADLTRHPMHPDEEGYLTTDEKGIKVGEVVADSIRSENYGDGSGFAAGVDADGKSFVETDRVEAREEVSAKSVRTELIAAAELRTPDFKPGMVGGVGGAITRDEDGGVTLEVDEIVARRKLNVNEVIINQSTHVGGRTLFSAANMECARVEDGGTYWRCYFDTKNGQKANLWQKDDLAYYQQYSPDNTQIVRYYWRLVTSVGEDWINLSKTTCDTGSGTPAEGDNIVQVGNRTECRRQSMLEVDMLSGGKVVLYAGISTFSFVDRNEGALGVNEKGEPYFYCYGDSFLGDRDLSDPDATYITFQTPEGETRRRMIVSADLHIGRGSSGLANLSEWHTKQAEIDRAGQAAADAKDKVENLQIGGVNLATGTATFQGGNLKGNYASLGRTPSDKFRGNTIKQTTGEWQGFYFEIEPTDFPTIISFWAKPVGEQAVFCATVSGSTGDERSCHPSNVITGDWKQYYLFLPNGGHLYNSLKQGVVEFASGNVYYSSVKVERGTKPTDWSPAPEDVKAEIDGIQIGGVNLVSGTKSAETGVADGDYDYLSFLLDEPVESGDQLTLHIGNAEHLSGSVTHYSAVIYREDYAYPFINNLLPLGKTTCSMTLPEGVSKQRARLLLYAGKAGQTVGNNIRFTDVTLTRGTKPMLSWAPSVSETKAQIDKAQADAAAANSAIAAMNDDGILDVSEKQSIRTQWEAIQGAANTTSEGDPSGSYKKTVALAGAKTSTEQLTTLYTTLRGYLDGAALYANTNTSDFARTTLAAHFKNYYNEEAATLDRISKSYVDEVQVGGVNLALNSKMGWHTTTQYNVVQGVLSQDWVVGQTYTITVKGTVNAGNVFGLWRDIGFVGVGNLIPLGNNLHRLVFVCPESNNMSPGLNLFSIYNVSLHNASSATIEWIKIERGNKPTDWSPAPEDVKAEIDGIQVGSVNLVDSSYNADCWMGNSGQYPIRGWVNADNQPYIHAGKTYTLVSELSVSDDFSGQGVCFFISGGEQIGKPFNPRTPTVVSVTFTAGIDGILSAYHYPGGSAGVSRIKWVKLVEGNKADITWSESPADTKAYSDQAAAGVQTSAVNYLKDSRLDSLNGWKTAQGTVTLVEDPKFGTVVQYQRVSGTGEFQRDFAIYNRSQLSNCDVIYYLIAKDINGDGGFAFGGWAETFNQLNYTSNSIDLGAGWKMYWVSFKAGATIGEGTFGINSIMGTWQFYAAGVSLGKNPPSSWTVAEGNLTDSIKIVNSAIAAMNDDGIFDIAEKQTIRTQWENISGISNTISNPATATGGSYIKTLNAAATLSVSTVALTSAFNALRAYLNALELYANSNKHGFIRSEMAAQFTAYYDAEKELSTLISERQSVAQGEKDKNAVAKDLGYADYAKMSAAAEAGQTIISRVKINPEEGMTLLENNKVTAKFTGTQIGSVLDNIPVNSNVLITEQKSRFSDTPENDSTTLTLASGVISGTSFTPVTIEIPPIRIYALMKLIRSEWMPMTTMYVDYLVNGVAQSSFEFTIEDFEEYEQNAGYDQEGYPIYETRYRGEMGRQITTPAFFITANSLNKPVLVQVRYFFHAQPDSKDVWDNKLYAQFPGSALEAAPASKYLDVGGLSFNSTFYGNGLIFSKSTNQIVGMSATAEGTELIARSGNHGLKVDKTGVSHLKSDGGGWDNSGLLCGYHVDAGGDFLTRFGIKDKNANKCGFQRNPGVYRLTHNIGHTDYVASVMTALGGFGFINIGVKSANYVDIEIRNYDEMLANRPFMILIFGRP